MSTYSEQGSWKPAEISDQHLEDIKRGARSREFGCGIDGVAMWELIGIIARLEKAEAKCERYEKALERIANARTETPLGNLDNSKWAKKQAREALAEDGK